MRKNLGSEYVPNYFLAALGNGGLAVGFYMYFMFLVPHPDTPMATFNHIAAAFSNGGIVTKALIAINILLIFYFSYRHFLVLAWNVREYLGFKKTQSFQALCCSNSEVNLMAMPLTFAMSINVLFVLGGAFIPNLWSVVEYLFPFALVGFAVVGFYALKIFSNYFVRLIVNGDFDFISNNNLSQAIAIFAFAMIGVGFASPGAMSSNIYVSSLGLFGAIFFGVVAASLSIVKLTLGLKSIFRHGIGIEAAPSLWIFIPILSILGILSVRMTHGFYHTMIHDDPSQAFIFLVTSIIISLQIMFGVVGYKVMKQVGYFRDYINGDKKSPGSYAIICPGVATGVFGFFFLNFTIVGTGLIDKYSLIYFALILPLLYVQLLTVRTVFKLDKKLLKA